MRQSRYLVLVLGLLLGCPTLAAWANPALEGYANYELYTTRVQKLAESKLVRIIPLGTSLRGRPIPLLAISRGEHEQKPAILIVGNVHANHLLGSELALRMAEQIIASEQEASIAKLLNECTLYILPRPDPDATEKAFVKPWRESPGNARQTDDDRDGQVGEDPPDDLNGDGWITMMRVTDPTGRWMPHPAEPRLLIEADRTKREQGQYSLYVEGRDDDHDEQFNEDAADGVFFHRNFPHQFPAFQTSAGPNPVSEVESRAVVDFCYDRPNIFAVFCFSPEDNVFHPWKADGKMHGKIPQSILANDAPYQDYLAQQYRELHGGKEPPEAAARQGSFVDWSYFQYGRWTFAARGWWPGKVAADAKPPGKEEPEKKKEEDKKLDEKRGKEDLDYLRWLTAENLPGFVEWQTIDHPQFPGKKVEVGGFKPFYRTHPAVAVIETLVPKQIAFLHKLVEARPKIALVEKKIEPLAGQLFRVTATLTNSGHLPTLSEMGETVGIHQRLQIQLQLPEQTRYLQGSPRVKLTRIEPQAKREVVWLVQLPAAQPTKGTLKIWSPEMDAVQQEIELIPLP